MTETLVWRKSSYSGGGNTDCVEVAHTRPGVVVRDSKDPDGTVIGFPGRAWGVFLRRLGG